MLSGVSVLFWKNWRIKQREHKFFQSLTGDKSLWLFPPLLIDVVLPVSVLLYIISVMCSYNVILDGPQDALASMMSQEKRQWKTSHDTFLLMTMLPQLLRVTNQSLYVSEDKDTKAFVEYLDREYTQVPELGIPSLKSKIQFIPRHEDASFAEEIDRMQDVWAGREDVYAILGVEQGAEKSLNVFFPKPLDDLGDLNTLNQDGGDEMQQLFLHHQFRAGNGNASTGDVRMPLILPFQIVYNEYLYNQNNDVMPISIGKPQFDTVCMLIQEMLRMTSIQWRELPKNSPFGSQSVTDCQGRLSKINLQTEITPTFLAFLTKFFLRGVGISNRKSSLDTSVLELSERPKFSKSGPFESSIAFYMVYLFLWPFTRLVRDIVNEKEKNLRNYLLIMGLHPMAVLMSWFALYAVASVVIVLLSIAFLGGEMYAVTTSTVATLMDTFTSESSVYLGMFLLAYATTVLLLASAVTPMFSQAKIAAAGGPMIYMLLCTLPWIENFVDADRIATSYFLRYFFAFINVISAPMVFMKAFRQILKLKILTDAAPALNLDISSMLSSTIDPMRLYPIDWDTVSAPIGYLFLQSIGYIIFGYYLETVFSSPDGVRNKWLFPCQPSYWFPNGIPFLPDLASSHRKYRAFDIAHPASAQDTADQESIVCSDSKIASYIDPETGAIRETLLENDRKSPNLVLSVQNISKTYSNGKEAVDNVSFCVMKGEIFGLLGPNGAGKSTIMSMLSGLLGPTSGQAYLAINDAHRDSKALRNLETDARGFIDVIKNADLLHRNLSVCFQQNLLYDTLTVQEHVELVLNVKKTLSIPTTTMNAALEKIKQFGLSEKLQARGSTLSGGQQRKLSLVLSLLDDSKLVILDEPTAGMDMHARMETWDTIRSAITDRALILTTHAMEEAQALCGNIAIMAEGKLQCCGSSMFLREKYGVGYKLAIVHAESTSTTAFSITESWIRMFIPGAVMLSCTKWETRFQLAETTEGGHDADGDILDQDTYTRRLILLFQELEQLKRTECIKHFTLRATDLEDVFVRVTEGEDVYNSVHSSEDTLDKASILRRETASFNSESATITAQRTLLALFMKRVKMTVRDKRMLFAQFVLPIVMFFILVLLSSHLLDVLNPPLKQMTSLRPSQASNNVIFVGIPELNKTHEGLLQKVVNKLQIAQVPVRTAGDGNTFVPLRVIVGNGIKSCKDIPARVLGKEYSSVSFMGAVCISALSDAGNMSIAVHTRIFYNSTVTDASSILIQQLSQAMCESNTTSSNQCAASVKLGKIHTKRHIRKVKGLMDQLTSSISMDKIALSSSRIALAIELVMTLSSISSFALSAIVREKELGLKRLQLLHLRNRFPLLTYWASHMLFDLLSLCVSACILLFGLRLLFPSGFQGMLFVAIIANTFACILSTVPFIYLVSLSFGSHSSGQAILTYISSFQLIAVTFNGVLSMMPGVCTISKQYFRYLYILPLFSYGKNVFNIATINLTPLRRQCEKFSESMSKGGDPMDSLGDIISTFTSPSKASVWDWDVSGGGIVWLLFTGLLYTLLFLSIDKVLHYPAAWRNHLLLQMKAYIYRFFGLRSTGVFHNIEDGSETGALATIQANYITKTYNRQRQKAADATPNQGTQVTALKDVSFAVAENDCVGLLGVNGSGKSTMFQILTGWVTPDQGQACIDGIDVTKEPDIASTRFGYCPQQNIVFDLLTVFEHCELFLALQEQTAVATPIRQAQKIRQLLLDLDLAKVADTRASELSGGNKRRLMLILAILNTNLPVLLLDEPSTGVDVVSRRLMWKILKKKQQDSGISCLFTTHSMEEAEAVCANAVILHLSKLVWSGSIQKLKQRAALSISISIQLDIEALWSVSALTRLKDAIYGDAPEKLNHIIHSKIIPRSELISIYKDAASARGEEGIPGWLNRMEAHFDSEIDLDFFMKEYLLQEQLAKIDTVLFQEKWRAIAGAQSVFRSHVDLQQASHTFHRTMVMYETMCGEDFGISHVLTILNDSKKELGIQHFVISEMSLEQMFDQLMQQAIH